MLPPQKNKDFYNNIGKIFDQKYRLTEFISEGGMGIVYKAEDVITGELAAVKILPPRFMSADKRGEYHFNLFLKEAEILSQLRHPNIVSVLGSGISDGLVFIAMELLEGCTLASEIMTHGKFSLERTSFVLSQICDALDVAHRQKIIHLDIKPNNVYLLNVGTSSETVKVIDFGLSRIIQSTLGSTLSRVVGTPQYMAPEIFLNRASHLSDVYSLGILTYEMLTGLLPFSQTHIYQLIHNQLTEPPPSISKSNKSVPYDIDKLLQKTLSKNNLDRPRSAKDFSLKFKLGLEKNDFTLTSEPDKPKVYVDNRKFSQGAWEFPSITRLAMAIIIIMPAIVLILFLNGYQQEYFSLITSFGVLFAAILLFNILAFSQKFVSMRRVDKVPIVRRSTLATLLFLIVLSFTFPLWSLLSIFVVLFASAFIMETVREKL